MTTETQHMAKPIGQWHLDKNINLSVLIVLVIQFIGFIVYVAKMDSRIESLETEQIKDNAMRDDYSTSKERITNIDRNVQLLRNDFQEVIKLLIRK